MKKLTRAFLALVLLSALSAPAFADVAPPFGGGSSFLGLSPFALILLCAALAAAVACAAAVIVRLHRCRKGELPPREEPMFGSAFEEEKKDDGKKV